MGVMRCSGGAADAGGRRRGGRIGRARRETRAGPSASRAMRRRHRAGPPRAEQASHLTVSPSDARLRAALQRASIVLRHRVRHRGRVHLVRVRQHGDDVSAEPAEQIREARSGLRRWRANGPDVRLRLARCQRACAEDDDGERVRVAAARRNSSSSRYSRNDGAGSPRSLSRSHDETIATLASNCLCKECESLTLIPYTTGAASPGSTSMPEELSAAGDRPGRSHSVARGGAPGAQAPPGHLQADVSDVEHQPRRQDRVAGETHDAVSIEVEVHRPPDQSQ